MRSFGFGRFMTAGVVAAVLALAPLASADTVRATSLPNGDLGATSSSGTVTNKDRDNDGDTLAKGDELGLFWSVANCADFAQTIHITVILDGPGTTDDMTFVDEDRFFDASGEQGCDIEQAFTRLKVKHQHFPEGTYSWSVTGSDSESVNATSTFAIDYGRK